VDAPDAGAKVASRGENTASSAWPPATARSSPRRQVSSGANAHWRLSVGTHLLDRACRARLAGRGNAHRCDEAEGRPLKSGRWETKAASQGILRPSTGASAKNSGPGSSRKDRLQGSISAALKNHPRGKTMDSWRGDFCGESGWAPLEPPKGPPGPVCRPGVKKS
jgi:hypothetical protein